MSKKAKMILICIVVLAVAATGTAVAYMNMSDGSKDEVQMEVVNKYLEGYKNPNLAAVRSVVSDEMKETLPKNQKAFKKSIESTANPNGKIKSWKINTSEINPYVGQTYMEATIMTTKTTYNVAIDLTGSDDLGWKIRAVKDLGGSSQNPNMGGMGQSTSGQSHGMQ